MITKNKSTGRKGGCVLVVDALGTEWWTEPSFKDGNGNEYFQVFYPLERRSRLIAKEDLKPGDLLVNEQGEEEGPELVVFIKIV